MNYVLITGDSHTGALYKGQTALETEGRWPHSVGMTIRPLGGGHLTREPFFADRGDHAQITTPEYRRHFERLPLEDGAGAPDIYGISAPLHSVRIWRHPQWKSFAPCGLPGDGIPLSSSLIRRVILDDQIHMLGLIEILLRNRKPVFVIEAPRPFRHHPALQTIRPDLILYIDRLYRSTLRQALDALAVPVVAVPERCLDKGFTLEDYAQPGDPHHGNAHYGRLMMLEILAFLASVPAPSADGGASSGPRRRELPHNEAADPTRAVRWGSSGAGGDV